MSDDATRTDTTIGIVGAGIMGRGIAQVAAEAGMRVLLADAEPARVAEAVAACGALIRRKAEKGQLSSGAADAAIARIAASPAGPQPGYAAFAACDLVVEAVVERMDIKHQVLAGVEAAVREDCIIATNTSSLCVTGFAAAARVPERIAGFHFFNPVPLMKIVEVIGGVLTAEAVLERLSAVARRMGHYPVRASDTPGFVVNHAGRGYLTEALRIVSEGIADVADVDRVMTEAAGFRLGPFELLDLTGLDVSQPVMDAIYHQYYEEPRYRPSVLVATRRLGGLLGRKTGRGFYAYADGKAQKPAEPPAPAIDPSGLRMWISRRDPAAEATLRAILAASGARMEEGAGPSPGAIAVVTPWGEDAGTAALAEGLDPARVVAIDPSTLGRRRTVMASPATDPKVRAAAHALFAADGAAVTFIKDSPGFIAQRIHAAIVNVGADMAQQRIAAPGDIDRAVELGLGYPRGPLKLGDEMGPGRILAILEAMGDFYRDPRYRPSPWLKRRARLGLPLHAPD
ncbi:3-hydroxyacyl-CoA dehydrogenase [Xanthobacter autotrophicus]|uniref:3-hydroxyacyl-CoA dehydrogenase n=1 Tax=Xanthobacter TaxID=279 RepID=UPI0024AA14AD|nr:3-hydroxyacyl-CoA dehydrogenase [Xanthobacter autotrophicus]MDI4663574.1 3-hydroxyacyl-CoA dehydrogenase [Xanthobacter autotrophicus]